MTFNKIELIVRATISNVEKIQDDGDLEDKKIEVVVYKENDAIVKISVSVDDSSISIQKQSDKNSQSFKIEAKQNNDSIFTLNIKFEGLQSIQNVKEDYELLFDVDNNINSYFSNLNEDSSNISSANKTTYKYIFKNDINFTYDADIEDFTDENSIMLTNYNQEAIGNFMSALMQRLQAINKRDMEKLGVSENENPLFQTIPNLGSFTLNSNQMNMTNNRYV